MGSYLVRRIGYGAVVAWAAVTIIFLVVRVLPGDPGLVMIGPSATPAQLARLRAEFGLDEPLVVQYLQYLRDVVRFDYGESLRLGGSAIAHVLDRLPASLALAACATSIAIAVGIPLGVAAALRNGSATDRSLTSMMFVAQSIPPFWLGVVLIIAFSRGLGWFPSSGAGELRSIVLPSLALATPFTAVVARLARAGLLEVLAEPYMDTARSKGLREGVVVVRHGIRNMIIPVVTLTGLQFGALIGGAVVIEVVFGWPGVGRLLIDAISNRDYPVVQAAVAVLAMLFVAVNLIVDVSYMVLDPRVRLGEGAQR